MNPPSLWDRIRRARMFRVLVVYLGASWAVLQIVDVLMSMLSLPRWVGPVAVVLLLVGFVVIVATAWVQSLPSTTAREATGEVPTDWQIAPADVLASLRRGKLPHLTWGRTILGGIVALCLLLGGAGAVVLLKGGGGLLSPQPLAADEAATGVAVVPFSVQGPDLEVWREGMVDLLSTGLDGLGGFRAIDSRTVLARWHGSVRDATAVELRDALNVAGSTGARYAVVGSAVSLGGQVRLTAEVYDLADGSKLDQAQVEGAPDEVMRLADKLAVDVTRILLGSEGRALVSESQVQSLSTSSLDALRSYLEGERLYRHGEFERAASAYEDAVAKDSAFASAYYRLTQAYGWMEAGGDHVERAELALRALRENLPQRDRLLLEGEEGLSTGEPAKTALMEDAVKRYPDDPDAWVLLGEYYVHMGDRVLKTLEDIRRVHAAAIDLDPTFAPTYIHQAENAMRTSQPDEARRLIDTYVKQAPETHQGVALSLGFALQFGGDTARAAAVAALDTVGNHTAADLTNGLADTPGGRDALISVADALWSRNRGPRWGSSRVLARLDRGRLDEVAEAIPSEDRGTSARLAKYLLELAGGRPDPSGPGDPASCSGDPFCLLLVGVWHAERENAAGARAVRTAFEAASVAATEPEAKEGIALFRRALDAHTTWRRGDRDAALAELTDIQVQPAMWGFAAALIRLWIAGILEQQARTPDAIRYLESLRSTIGLGAYSLLLEARTRAGSGDATGAQAAYRAFLEMWSGAPADHPWLVEARIAIPG